jgi:ubiquitin-protein ligase
MFKKKHKLVPKDKFKVTETNVTKKNVTKAKTHKINIIKNKLIKNIKEKTEDELDEEILLNLEETLATNNEEQLHSKGIDDKYKDINYDWIKLRHQESLKILKNKLLEKYDTLSPFEIFNEINKEGIIAEICIDNFVTRNLQNYPDKVFLLLELVVTAVNNDSNNINRLVYSPKSSISLSKIKSNLAGVIKNLQYIMEKKELNDIYIIDRIGFDMYKVVKFTLYNTQKIDIKPSTILSSKDLNDIKKTVNQKGGITKYGVAEISTNLYEILYQDEKPMENNFYFHGSKFMNWYSIINNGLYVPKSHQILNGSAYGVGIYLANNAATSLSYMGSFTGKAIMGIAQVNNPKKYNKGGFLVVTNSDDVRLKYIIVFNNNQYGNTYLSHQANMLTNKLIQIKNKTYSSQSGEITNNICIKRVNKELKQIYGMKKIYDFSITVEYDEKKINIWTITIETPKDKWGTMIWEIRFDNEYPVKPPFIRIIKPHFKYLSGHITIGGAFCNPILTNQKWRASISIPNLIQMLLVNMEEGGAELDKTSTKADYSLESARKAYNRYKVAHGWD